MPQSTKPIAQLNSPRLHVIRDEDPPPYDDDAPQAKREAVVIVSASAGETILGTLGTGAFGVYWHLVRRSKNGQCWPSLDDISEGVNLSRKHVIRMLDALENDGWITREKRHNARGMSTSTLYTIPEKERTFGCDMDGTRAGHGQVVNVTRTKGELGENKNTNTPPTPSRGKREPSPKKPIPENLAELIPPATWSKLATEQVMTDDDLHRETEKMIDFYQGKGEKRPDWIATWRSWMRSPYRKPAPRQSSPAPTQQAAPSLHPELKRRLDGWMAESAEIGREPFPLPVKLQTDIDNWKQAQRIGSLT